MIYYTIGIIIQRIYKYSTFLQTYLVKTINKFLFDFKCCKIDLYVD